MSLELIAGLIADSIKEWRSGKREDEKFRRLEEKIENIGVEVRDSQEAILEKLENSEGDDIVDLSEELGVCIYEDTWNRVIDWFEESGFEDMSPEDLIEQIDEDEWIYLILEGRTDAGELIPWWEGTHIEQNNLNNASREDLLDFIKYSDYQKELWRILGWQLDDRGPNGQLL